MARAISQLSINDNLRWKPLKILQSLGRDKFCSTTIRPYGRLHGLLNWTIILQDVNLQRNDFPLKRLLAAFLTRYWERGFCFRLSLLVSTSSFQDAAIHLACTKISAWRNQEVSWRYSCHSGYSLCAFSGTVLNLDACVQSNKNQDFLFPVFNFRCHWERHVFGRRWKPFHKLDNRLKEFIYRITDIPFSRGWLKRQNDHQVTAPLELTRNQNLHVQHHARVWKRTSKVLFKYSYGSLHENIWGEVSLNTLQEIVFRSFLFKGRDPV